MKKITIDMRMMNASGIGTYLSNLIPLIVMSFPNFHFNLLGKIAELKSLPSLSQKNVSFIEVNAPIYSISEQIELAKKIPKDTSLYWATHYNYPLLRSHKLLVTIYDLFHLAMPELVGGIHKRLYAKQMFRGVKKKSASIITISDFTTNEFIKIVGKPTSINSIHLGVEDSWFHIKKMEKLHPKPFLLFVGNVKPHKNLTNLIKAFELITHQISHDLVIVGKKEGFITGDKLVSEKARQLGDRIHFTGYVEYEVLKNYFAHADLFVFPSLYEGFGLPPLEAMAAQCPVVTSNAASLPEVFGDAALYFDPKDPTDIAAKILKITSEPSLKETLIAKGTKRAREFTWEKCAKKTSDIIISIL